MILSIQTLNEDVAELRRKIEKAQEECRQEIKELTELLKK